MAPGPLPSTRAINPIEQVGALVGCFADERGSAHGCRPGAVILAEQLNEGLAQALGAQGAGVEQRELPSIERLEQFGILDVARQSAEHLACDSATEAVKPRGLARRYQARQIGHRAEPVEIIVEELDNDRAGRYGAGHRKSQG